MDKYYLDDQNERIIRSEEGKMMYEYIDKRNMLWHPTYFSHPKRRDAYLADQNYQEISVKDVIKMIQNWRH